MATAMPGTIWTPRERNVSNRPSHPPARHSRLHWQPNPPSLSMRCGSICRNTRAQRLVAERPWRRIRRARSPTSVAVAACGLAPTPAAACDCVGGCRRPARTELPALAPPALCAASSLGAAPALGAPSALRAGSALRLRSAPAAAPARARRAGQAADSRREKAQGCGYARVSRSAKKCSPWPNHPHRSQNRCRGGCPGRPYRRECGTGCGRWQPWSA